jgi:hypothetical protein
MLARVKILQPKREENDDGTWTEQHIFIPKSSINDLDNPNVWIVDKANKGLRKATKRSLTLGDKEFDGWIEILSGLSTGDRIITSETALKEGDSVQIIGGQE